MPGVTFTHGFDGITDISDLMAGGVTYVAGSEVLSVASDRFQTNNQKCIRIRNSVALGRTLDAPVIRVITGVSIMYENILVGPLIAFYDVAAGHPNRIQCFVDIDTTNGIVRFWRATHDDLSSSVLLAQSSANIVNAAVWFYLEIDVTIHPTAGAVRVRLNGTTDIIALTGLNTQYTENTACQGVQIQMNPTTGQLNNFGNFDDWYIIEPIGAPSDENAMLGNIQLFSVFPNAAGSHTDFTPNSGTNYSQVSETAVDGDTTYNHSQTVGAIDSFHVTALPSDMVPFFVIVKTTCKQDSAGDHTLRSLIRSSTTELLGNELSTFQGGYRQQFDVISKDPNGTIAWTNASVSAMEIGYKLAS